MLICLTRYARCQVCDWNLSGPHKETTASCPSFHCWDWWKATAGTGLRALKGAHSGLTSCLHVEVQKFLTATSARAIFGLLDTYVV